jgi:hypothetical protein
MSWWAGCWMTYRKCIQLYVSYVSCHSSDWVWLSFMRFLDYKQRRATVSTTSLDEWSARRRGLYLTTHNTHNRKTSMPPMGFEPRTPASERPQTYTLGGPLTYSFTFSFNCTVDNCAVRSRVYWKFRMFVQLQFLDRITFGMAEDLTVQFTLDCNWTHKKFSKIFNCIKSSITPKLFFYIVSFFI